MIPRRSRDLPFGRSSSLFSYKRRYNGNLCAHSVQQAKAAASTMTCTLSAPAAYFLSTTVLYARNVSPTAHFLPTAAKSMKKCRQKPMVSGLPFLSRAAFVMGRKGDRLCNKPAAAPSQVKGACGSTAGGVRIPTTSLRTGRGNDRGWQGGKRTLSPVGRAPFCMEKYQSLTCSGRLSP